MNAQKALPASLLPRIALVCALAWCAPVLSGCDLMHNTLKYDREKNKEFQDVRDGLAPRLPEVGDQAATADSAIPSLQPYIASPKSSKAMPLVSISVNQSVPLRDVLYELAQQADYDIELDPRITGSIIFTARERPFDEVVERVAAVGGLRYKFEDDILRVELDTPYNKIYKVDYLSFIRKNKGNIRNNIAVVSGDGADTGSQYEASSESEADFWGEVEQNLQQLLGGNVSGALKTSRTPKISATEGNPAVAATAPTDENGNPAGGAVAQPPQAVLNVESLPTEEEEEPGAASQAPAGDSGNGFTFTINKQAGIINVYASEKSQKEVEGYLVYLRKAVTSQVLIEAKILEVSLDDEHATGIDWRLLDLASGELAINYLSEGFGVLDAIGPDLAPAASGTAIATDSNFVVGYSGNDVQAVIQAISGFGSVKALASPRLTVLNNQSAVLNVATNHVFFDVDIDVTTDADTGRTVDIQSDIRNVPEGVLVNVQPSINLENGTISLSVRPTVTRIVSEQADPAVQFITADAGIEGVQSLVPELNVQEIDSVIQVRSGQAVVMGGLLQDRTEASEEGVPVLSETPMLGRLFKQHNDRIQKTELVIFLKATILKAPEDTVDNTDKDTYRRFSSDRHPFKL